MLSSLFLCWRRSASLMVLLSLFTLLCTVQVLYASSPVSQIILNAEPVTGCGIRCAASNQTFVEKVSLRDEYSGAIEFQWVGEIGVGTPSQVVRVIFDTGSCRLLVPSVECTSESCDGKKKFDPKQSSTYESFHIVKNISFDITAGDVTPVKDGDYNVTVVEGMETVTIGQLRANDVSTELIIQQTPAFAKHTYDGILGFGPSSCKDSFMNSAIKRGVPAVFGFYLTPHAVGNAELTIGGIDRDKLQSPLVYVPAEPPDTFAALNFSLWVVNTTGISVNGKTSHTLNQTLSLIVDTGTSNMVFPEQITRDIYSLISPEISPLDEFGTWGIECDKRDLLHAQLEFSLVAENGDHLHLKVPNEELFVGKYGPDPKFCQTYINSFEGVSIIGGSVLKYYYTVWNMDAKNPQLGFALNKY